MRKRTIFVALTTYQLYITDLYANYIIDCIKDADVCVIAVGLDVGQMKQNVDYNLVSIPDLNRNAISRVWQRLYWGGNLFFLSPLRKYIEGKGISLFVFNDNEPITNKIIRIVKQINGNTVTIIEEGIGIYSYTNERLLNYRERIRLFITTLLGSPMQYSAIGDNKLIDCAIVGNTELYASLKKSKGQRVITQNKTALYNNADLFLEHYCDSQLQDIRADYLYLGQPFDEYGNLLDEEKRCIETIISLLDVSKRMIIKPHPRDAEHKYDCFAEKYKNVYVIESRLAKLPVECLVCGLDLKYVISFNSSAGVNIANSFENIKCIFFINASFAESIKRYWNKIGAVYDENIYKSANNNTFLPMDKETFTTILNMNSEVVAKNESENDEGKCYGEIEAVLQLTNNALASTL